MTWCKYSALCALQLWNSNSSAPNIVHADKKLSSSYVIFTSMYFDKECHWYLYFTLHWYSKNSRTLSCFFFFFLLLCLWRSFLFSWMKWKDDHSFIQQKFLPSWSFHSSEGTPKMKNLMYMLIGIHTKEKIKQNKYRMMGDCIQYHV